MLQQSAVKHTYFIFLNSSIISLIILLYENSTSRIKVLRETRILFDVILQYLINSGCSINENGETVLTINYKLAESNSA